VHCYDTYYSSQGYKLHYPVDKGRENKNSKTYIQRTMSAVKQNLSHLEAAPSVQFQDLPGPGGSGSIDTTPLFYEQAPREDDDPMERLRRLCGEREERCFFRVGEATTASQG
jgi:histone deacetylase 1/2